MAITFKGRQIFGVDQIAELWQNGTITDAEGQALFKQWSTSPESGNIGYNPANAATDWMQTKKDFIARTKLPLPKDTGTVAWPQPGDPRGGVPVLPVPTPKPVAPLPQPGDPRGGVPVLPVPTPKPVAPIPYVPPPGWDLPPVIPPGYVPPPGWDLPPRQPIGGGGDAGIFPGGGTGGTVPGAAEAVAANPNAIFQKYMYGQPGVAQAGSSFQNYLKGQGTDLWNQYLLNYLGSSMPGAGGGMGPSVFGQQGLPTVNFDEYLAQYGGGPPAGANFKGGLQNLYALLSGQADAFGPGVQSTYMNQFIGDTPQSTGNKVLNAVLQPGLGKIAPVFKDSYGQGVGDAFQSYMAQHPEQFITNTPVTGLDYFKKRGFF